MPRSNSPNQSGPRIAAIVVGSVLSLFATGLLAAGGVAVWGDSKKDEHGYISTGSDRFATSTHALTTDELDVEGDAPGWLVDEGVYGKIRLRVDSNDQKPLFVGVARTGDVERYLSGTAHSKVTDVEYSPFEADYRDHAGGRPAVPGEQGFWEASSHGPGTQTLTWDVEDGSWSVVVMNADGSAGVDAGVSAGAKLSWLGPHGWSLLGSGLVFLVAAGGLLVYGVRTPSAPRATHATVTA